MGKLELRKFSISFYLVFVFLTLGFIGIFTYQEITNTGSVSATTIIVAKSGPRDYSNIQDAIDNAKPGDTIKVYSGIYFGNVEINKKISLIGNGSVNTTIDGGGIGNVVTINNVNDVKICGFTVINSGHRLDQNVLFAGIKLSIAENVVINYNNCSNNEIGINLWNSNLNIIENNNCLFNDDGIFLRYSNSNNLNNNTCVANQYYGMIIKESESNSIINNACNSNNGSGIIILKSPYNNISRNVCNHNFQDGIYLNGSNFNIIDTNICNSNAYNIAVSESISNNVTNNSCSHSLFRSGIGIFQSKFHVLKNNSMFNCSILIDGFTIQYWNSHTVDLSNSVNNKPVYYWRNRTGDTIPSNAGKVILVNCTNVKVKNLEFASNEAPIQIGFSFNNTITNNTFTNNSVCIYTQGADNNSIANNTFYSNYRMGILICASDMNTIENNYISNVSRLHLLHISSSGIGVYLGCSEKNLIKNNSCNFNNDVGIELYTSDYNTITSNNISSNPSGIVLHTSSNNNVIINNYILKNNEKGITINSSHNNKIHHNDFIQNSVQATVIGYSYNNRWDNSNGEGNYWSDYTGLDNGANGRAAYDGVGDTEIPHLGLDNFPLVNQSGWLYPGIPTLYNIETEFDDFDSNGDYIVNWTLTRGVMGYILEEDVNSDFKTSLVVYNGSDATLKIVGKDNGTYYYRVKGYNEDYLSIWSNVVNVTVDYPPDTPKNLTISVFPAGNILNITWEPNQIDTSEYNLYYKLKLESFWHRAAILKHPKCVFNHTNLVDGQEYEYKISSRDGRNQESIHSEIVIGIPNDSIPPAPPKNLRVIATTYRSLKLTWEPNTEDDLEGYNIYKSIISNPSSWGEPIFNLTKGSEEFLDIDVDEITTYYYVITAFDEVPNESGYSNLASGTTKIGQCPPEVNNSISNVYILEDTIDNVSINLCHWFFDVNGDNLTYWCRGDLYIEIVMNLQDGTVSIIPERNWCGNETITFYCSDEFNVISDEVTITVIPVNDPPDTPEIVSPENGYKFSEGKKINFKGYCSDPDLPYGDELTFYWSSDISGDLGSGSNLNGRKIPVGEHKITLTVKDLSGNSSYATIDIKVLEKESSTPSILFTNTGMFILIIIIILIMIFIFFKKKRTRLDKKQGTKPSVGGFADLSDTELGLPSSTSSLGGPILPPSQRSAAAKLKPVTPKLTYELSSTLPKIQEPSITTTPKPAILSYPSKLIGRDHEMNKLKGFLEGAIQSETHTIFITGEAGIGKTRLVYELMQVAQARGFQILSSKCEYESITPYMPFIKALKFGGLDHLFAEEAPRVEAVYLVTNGGVLIKEVLRQETKLRPDIFASMLTAVSNFVKESLSIMSDTAKEGELNTLGYENYRILIESGKSANIVVLLTGKENEFLINDIRDIHLSVEKHYELALKTWDGNEKKIKGIEQLMKPIITSGKYDGVYYSEHDPKAKRDLLFENVAMGLVRKSEDTPILLCIEDLQWSDPSSLALLYHISKNSKNNRFVILGTYRPEELTLKKDTRQPLIEIMQLMEHEGLIYKMALARLLKESSTELLTSILGGGISDDGLRNFVYHETEGNPLFIIQLVKYLIEEKIIMHTDGTWKLAKNADELNIPPKIYHVIVLRLGRLEKGSRKVLEYASVIGETFSSKLLGEALSLPRLELLSQLRILEQKHKLLHSDNGNYRFDHGKIKEVVYSEIPMELRIEYHSIIAKMIEKLNKDKLHEVIEELAFHYYQCKNKEKAKFYLLEVAKKAKRNYSNSEAIRFYREALELEEDASNRRDILDSIGRIYDLMGEYDQALESFSATLKLTTDPKKLAEVKAKLGIIYLKKGDYDNSLSFSTEALGLVKGESSSEEALAFESIGHAYHRKGDYDNAIKYHKKGLEIHQKISNQKGIASSFQNLGVVLLDNGNYGKALKNFKSGLKLFEQLGDNHGIQKCFNNIGMLHFQKGEYKKAFEYYEKSLGIIENIGDQGNKALLLLNIGHSLLLIGETKKALDNLEKSLAISKNNDLHMVTACNYWVMSEAYIELGNHNIALDYCNRAFDLALNLGNKEILGSLRRVLGIIYKKQGNWGQSIDNFKESIKILSEIANDKELGDSYYEFGLMWKEKGETEIAKENLKNAYNIFEKLKLNNNKENVKKILDTL